MTCPADWGPSADISISRSSCIEGSGARPTDEKRSSLSRAQSSWTSVGDEVAGVSQVARSVPRQRMVDETLNLTRCHTGSQCSWRKTGEMRSHRRVPVTNRGLLDWLEVARQVVSDAVASTDNECLRAILWWAIDNCYYTGAVVACTLTDMATWSHGDKQLSMTTP